ncbi:sigma-54 dependent transcriptional regulator [Photobacterium sp.]|uniref:sigma-54-dependent transcriptional regulator n=1 Tax=Photobacterium sp. TaxID=660 RepID=UPI00299EA20F|nr:sigma-54 dependent transcriptional regulator [Photobacterium sp.]MDX1304314.1 sigma-54 dependent transcriptional regulator [Photobacterium sp.]
MMLSNDIQVVLIDDDQHVLNSCQHLLQLAGYKTRAFQDPRMALKEIHPNWSGVILTDIYMPTMSGMELIDKVKAISPHLPIITITGHGDISMAVEAMQKGAVNYLEKPLKPKKLLNLLEKVIAERKNLVEQWQIIENSLPEQLLGTSTEIEELRNHIKLLASADKDALIQGESGTGRYTTATLLHEHSPRSSQPLVVRNGNSIQSVKALECTLEEAEKGSLILQDPGSMPAEVQRFLSHFLLNQERSGKRSVKLIAIFGECPENELKEHRLLPELFYFLSQVRFAIPPLRQRKEDVIPLFRHFLKKSCALLGKQRPKVDKAYLDTLKRHQWPGNIRELKSVAELYAIGMVKLSNADRTQPIEQMTSPLDDLVEQYEKQLIEDALYLYAGRINDVSEYLKIQRKKLYLRMRKYDLDKNNYKVN